jgi:hypothetical protein
VIVMKTRRRVAVGAALMLAGAVASPAAPANAATTQIAGDAYYATACPQWPAPDPDAYSSYPPLVLTGSLTGCMYTHVDQAKTTPSGVYLESGREVFVGSLDGGASGTFTTTYRFEAKYDPDGSEVHGRCQHPIVDGSGTGGFAGIDGRLAFKDLVQNDPVTFVYRGHLG